MDGQYRLITCVDPSKTPHELKERFAKLTLSSAKSKKKDEAKYGHHHDSPTESILIGKSLFEELLTDDESDDNDNRGDTAQNKIFLSQNPKASDEGPAPKASFGFSQKLQLSSDDSDETFCSAENSDEKNLRKSTEMEELVLSESQLTRNSNAKESQQLFTQSDEQPPSSRIDRDDPVGSLSTQISNLGLLSPVKLKRTSDFKTMTITNIVRNIQDDDTEANTDESILTISSTTSSPMKDAREVSVHVLSSDDEIITVSDSEEPETDDFSRRVSNIKSTSDGYTCLSSSATRRLNNFFQKFPDVLSGTQDSLRTQSPSGSPLREKSHTLYICESPATPQSQAIAKIEKVSFRQSADHSLEDTPERSIHMAKIGDLKESFSHSTESQIDEDIIQESIEISETSVEGSISNITTDSQANLSSNKATCGSSKDISVSSSNKVSDTQPDLSSNKATLGSGKDTSNSSNSSENYVESINISAKIKIKVHISQPTITVKEACSPDTSDKPSNDNEECASEDNISNEKPSDEKESKKDEDIESTEKEYTQVNNQALNRKEHEQVEKENLNPNTQSDVSSTPKKGLILSNNIVMLDECEKNILDKVYGKDWQTPEILKKLTAKSPIMFENKQLDESCIDDFSIFHKNIRTDLESTRLPTIMKERAFKKPTENIRLKNDRQFVTPAQKVKVTRSGREVKQRLQAICDTSSSSENERETDTHSNNSWEESEKEEDEKGKARIVKKKSSKGLVYLDLTSDVIQEVSSDEASFKTDNDEQFQERLQDILKSCEYVEGKKISRAPSSTKTKRKLFSPRFGDEDEDAFPPPEHTFEKISSPEVKDDVVKLKTPLPLFTPVNKKLESIRKDTPFCTKKTKGSSSTSKKKNIYADDGILDDELNTRSAPRQRPKCLQDAYDNCDLAGTPDGKYGFLKSLDVNVAKRFCHPDALNYRENYKTKKQELLDKLYRIYNEKIFKNELDVEIKWNKKLLNTAGRCTNTKKGTVRSSCVELSEKVLTSADRLRCTLIHELCHAATWIFNGENGHGAIWKSWAGKANRIFPELPKIGVCHQYDIHYKYTYKCTLCAAKSHAHSKSKKVENLRCAYCHGAIEVFLNKTDKEGNVVPTPVREPTGFAKFVKDNYKVHKTPSLTHAQVMKILSSEFAAININEKK